MPRHASHLACAVRPTLPCFHWCASAVVHLLSVARRRAFFLSANPRNMAQIASLASLQVTLTLYINQLRRDAKWRWRDAGDASTPDPREVLSVPAAYGPDFPRGVLVVSLVVAAGRGFRYGHAHAPVAQLDRVQDSESWGHRFKSCRVRQLNQRVSFDGLRVKRERPTFCLRRFRLLLLPIGSPPTSEQVPWNETLVPPPAFALISDVQFFFRPQAGSPAELPAYAFASGNCAETGTPRVFGNRGCGALRPLPYSEEYTVPPICPWERQKRIACRTNP